MKRYGWSANLNISILTDFEEFVVYDCTEEPDFKDAASRSRLKCFNYKQYLDNFEYLWNTFSKDAVTSGDFRKYIKNNEKKGSQKVDEKFLIYLDNFRTNLAKDIFKNNHGINEDQLNIVVQKLINRIIFLRIAEDRDIEIYGRIKNLSSKKNIYKELVNIFDQANNKYNAGLFTFEKDRVPKNINVSDKCLKNIISGLYFPNSPYEFSEIPLEILGTAYEEFLGKVIQIKKNKIKIEIKPEVKKAGGVFYTPEYIVKYVVEETVGKLIKGKAPSEIEKIKIVDPSSGSGSFLIGAYDYLLSYHAKWYFDNKSKFKNPEKNPLNPNGSLKTEIKKQILLNNIFGVDIDRSAVEVTKLSLLLKCLEGETSESIGYQNELLHKRVLPTLDENIKCGNSLVGMEFLEQTDSLVEQKIVKPFDWETSFEKVFDNNKGFDAVIGNPPWVRHELLKSLKPYFENTYKVYNGKADLYSFFIEKGMSLLNEKGLFGYIVPNKWFRADYGTSLRIFLKRSFLKKIVDFDDVQVFRNATTYPCLLFIEPGKKSLFFDSKIVKTLDFNSINDFIKNDFNKIKISDLREDFWCIKDSDNIQLLNKLLSNGVKLESYVNKKVFYGIKTGLNEAFVIDENKKNELISKDPKSEELIKPFLAGREVKQYKTISSKEYFIFTRRGTDINKYPAIRKHLEKFKKKLQPKPKNWKADKNENKWNGRKSGSYKWFEIQDSIDYYAEFEKPKIVYPNICKKPEFAFDNSKLYTNQKCFIIPLNDFLLLGILNSSVMEYLFKEILPRLRGGFLEPSWIILKNFSIPQIKKDSVIGQDLVKNVQLILKFQDENDYDKVKYYKKQVDKIVYNLYKVNIEEVRLIEDAINEK